MTLFVDPELYKTYKDEILDLSDSVQVSINEHLTGPGRPRPLSDAEIAEKLGLDEAVVREIRVVAERDRYPLEEWQEAIEFKKRACEAFSEHGVSYATKKYLKRDSPG